MNKNKPGQSRACRHPGTYLRLAALFVGCVLISSLVARPANADASGTEYKETARAEAISAPEAITRVAETWAQFFLEGGDRNVANQPDFVDPGLIGTLSDIAAVGAFLMVLIVAPEFALPVTAFALMAALTQVPGDSSGGGEDDYPPTGGSYGTVPGGTVTVIMCDDQGNCVELFPESGNEDDDDDENSGQSSGTNIVGACRPPANCDFLEGNSNLPEESVQRDELLGIKSSTAPVTERTPDNERLGEEAATP